MASTQNVTDESRGIGWLPGEGRRRDDLQASQAAGHSSKWVADHHLIGFAVGDLDIGHCEEVCVGAHHLHAVEKPPAGERLGPGGIDGEEGGSTDHAGNVFGLLREKGRDLNVEQRDHTRHRA